MQDEVNKIREEVLSQGSQVAGKSIPVSDDPNVLKSEIDDIRKSVVSMSVGQPKKPRQLFKSGWSSQHQHQLQNQLQKRVLMMKSRKVKKQKMNNK